MSVARPAGGAAALNRRLASLEAEVSKLRAAQRVTTSTIAPSELTAPLTAALPTAVTAPTVTTKLGTITVTTPVVDDPQVDRVAVYVSAVNNFEPDITSLVGAIHPPDNDLVVAKLVVGTTYYVRLVNVSKAGQRGTPSDQTAILVKGVTAPDIEANSITANQLAVGSVTTEKIAAGAVTADEISAGAIDGKVITGATIQTAATGERLTLNATNFGAVQFYTGDTSESSSGTVKVDTIAAPGAVYQRGIITINPPAMGGYGTPTFSVMSAAADNTIAALARVDSDEIELLANKITVRQPMIPPSYQLWQTPTLLNSWAQFDATNEPVRYIADVASNVWIQGRVKTGTIAATIFTLAAGTFPTYRPSKKLVIPSITANSGGAQIQITTAGVVSVLAAAVNADAQTWTSLNIGFSVL